MNRTSFGVALAALGLGLAANLAARIWLPLPSLPTARSFRPELAPPLPERGPAIVARDLFCSRCTRPATGIAASPSDLPFELIATMVVRRDPQWSLAVIRAHGIVARDPTLYRRGMRLPDGESRIVRVDDRRVYLARHGQVSFLSLDDHWTPPAPNRSPTDDGAIRCGGSGCTIGRARVEAALADLPSLAREVRFVPSSHGGIKLYAIRPGSLFAQLGFENGDLVSTVNGLDARTPDQWLEIYTRLRNASRVAVTVERRGQPLTLDYAIVNR